MFPPASTIVEKVADMANWGRTMEEGRGLGIAVHRSFLSTVGTVAEVSVNDAGKLIVHELWTAIDAGLDNRDALVALTSGPAGILGISERVGTIESGKIANLILRQPN